MLSHGNVGQLKGGLARVGVQTQRLREPLFRPIELTHLPVNGPNSQQSRGVFGFLAGSLFIMSERLLKISMLPLHVSEEQIGLPRIGCRGDQMLKRVPRFSRQIAGSRVFRRRFGRSIRSRARRFAKGFARQLSISARGKKFSK